MSQKPSLVVLAAGLGSRYGGFKQIDPVGPNREIIIDYSVYDAIRAGFDKIVVVTVPELEEPIREHFARTQGDLNLVFAYQQLDDLPEGFTLPEERKKPWGTGHAIWSAREHLDGPFGVINADDFYGPTSYKVLADALVAKPRGEYCMVGFELAKTLSEHGSVSRGICTVDCDGYLVEVVENTNIVADATVGARTEKSEGVWETLPLDCITSMNLWGFDETIVPHLESQFRDFLKTEIGKAKSEFFIPTVVDTLIKSGQSRCKVFRSTEQWFGVTYREDREIAVASVQKLIAGGVYPQALR